MKTIKNLKAEEIRKSILQLAIQGKLVKQNPNDEPASELVKRIYAEKQKLIKEGKIKKDKIESYIFKGDDNCYYEKIGNNKPVKLDDLPFDIPDNWTWIRLKNIANISAGGTPDRGTPKYWNGKIPWLKISDITSSNKYVRKASEYITEDGINNSSAKMMRKGTILYTIFATIGEVGILDIDATCNQAIAGLDTYDKTINEFLYFLLVNLQDYMKSISKGCAQFNINQKILKEAIIAMPPFEEQLRIVNKINSFEPLLLKYEVAESKLSKLESEFPEKLKKSILQYAIEGKLVKQDPNDEPASVLLERIKTEKEKLIKEGKIKRDKKESYIYQGDDKNYYENIPSNWYIVPLRLICEVKGGKRIPAGEKFSPEATSYKYLRVTDMKNHTIVGCAYISQKIFEIIKNYRIYDDEIYITVAGTIGYVGTVPKNYSGANLTENADKLLLNKLIYKPWFVQYLCSEVCQKQIKNCTTKVGQPKLAIKRIEEFFILLPPKAEQKRIYEKTINLLNYL